MTVRSVDLQVLIPKAPEVQKAKMMEQGIPQNNELIDMDKGKRAAEAKLSQVNRKERPEIIRINEEKERERHKKEQEEQQREKREKREKLLEAQRKENEKKRAAASGKKGDKKPDHKIDIRV